MLEERKIVWGRFMSAAGKVQRPVGEGGWGQRYSEAPGN